MEQIASEQEEVGQEEDKEEEDKEEDDDYNPGIKAGPGASERIFSKTSTLRKKQKLLYSFFLFGPEVSYKYWTHWFNHVDVIRTAKSKLVI